MKTILFWSGGKDSMAALLELEAGGHRAELLLSTYSSLSGRIPMQEIPLELAELQAERLGLPIVTVPLPSPCPNADYMRLIARALEPPALTGLSLAFGDIHLQEIRSFREQQFAASGRQLLFPLWGREPAVLSREIAASMSAVLTCVDTARLDPRFLGRSYDESLLGELPTGPDPCGENGEFHTFVWDSPRFSAPIRFSLGDVRKEGSFAWRVPGAV